MQLTEEQKATIERQRRENPGGRLRIELTDEQRRDYQQAVEQEEAGREKNLAWRQKITAAAQEVGFSGDLRRAILNLRGLNSRLLADKIGVALDLFEAFRAGEAELPTSAVDRLVESLGLRLVPMEQA
jgi:hypothetical protein